MDFTTDSPSLILSSLTYVSKDISEALVNAAAMRDTLAVRKYADQLDAHRLQVTIASRALSDRTVELHRRAQNWRGTPEGDEASAQLKEINDVLLKLVWV